MNKNSTPLLSFSLKVLTLSVLVFGIAQKVSAQWVAYTFSPRAAFISSYGLNTNSNNTSAGMVTNGWPTSAGTAAGAVAMTNPSARGVIVLYFSTNTNSPNFITATQPLFYPYTNSSNLLSTNNYATNFPLLALTNTSATNLEAFGNTNIWFYNRTRFSNSTRFVAGQFVLSSPNTNAVGTFNASAVAYTTNQIGTNNWTNAGLTNYLPASISLKISSLSFAGTNTPLNATNQQLTLPLAINLTLTKALNNIIATNTNYATALAAVVSNLPRLIRSNGVVLTNTNP